MGSWTAKPARTIRPINRTAQKRKAAVLPSVLGFMAILGMAYPQEPVLFVPAKPSLQVVNYFGAIVVNHMFDNLPNSSEETPESTSSE